MVSEKSEGLIITHTGITRRPLVLRMSMFPTSIFCRSDVVQKFLVRTCHLEMGWQMQICLFMFLRKTISTVATPFSRMQGVAVKMMQLTGIRLSSSSFLTFFSHNDRPVAGYLNFCPRMRSVQTERSLIQHDIFIILHELVHILGEGFLV